MLLAAFPLLLSVVSEGQTARRIPIEAGKGLEPVNVLISTANYHGREAVRLIQGATANRGIGESVALVSGIAFQEGTIELDVAGFPGEHAQPDDRGFIGIAFHIPSTGDRFKTFYIRPTNGRADDQLRRNHVTQFTSEPDWPWERLRKEQPGVYESYVDVVTGEWTPLKIVIAGGRAELYVNGATQPSLIITDMKDPATGSGIALWIGRSTEGYFSNLRVTPKAGSN